MSAQRLISAQKSRLEALRNRHAVLSLRVEDAQKSPSANDFYLRQLKKQKLALKEEMFRNRESGNASA